MAIGCKRGTIDGVTTRQEPTVEPERGLVLTVLPRSADAEEELGELRELAARPVSNRSPSSSSSEGFDPRTYVGKGKLDELKQAYSNASAGPPRRRRARAAQHALENALTARVVDRTQLILDIFAQRDERRGKLQVELAQLEYNLPRMRGMWQHLERLGGGTGALGGGCRHTRPGESQLETDRRLARRKISLLRRRLKGLRQAAVDAPEGARAQQHADGRARRLHERRQVDASERAHGRGGQRREPPLRDARPDHAASAQRRRYLVTDTVGFIRRLPAQLVEGFASTLEETLVADLVLHVLDASESDDRLDEMTVAVEAVLHEIGADDVPQARPEQDRPGRPARSLDGSRTLSRRAPDLRRHEAPASARCRRIAQRFADRFEEVRLLLPYDEAESSRSYALEAPIEEREDSEEGVLVAASPAAARGAAVRALPRRRVARRRWRRSHPAVVARALQDGAPLPRPQASRLASAIASRSSPASVASWAALQARPRLGRDGLAPFLGWSTVIAHGLLHLLGGLAASPRRPRAGYAMCCRRSG